MAMFINPNDPNRNKPLVQTYDPVAGTSTGLKPYTAKPAVSSNPVPSPAPAPTPRPSPTARPTKVVGRNPVNTTPKFKSELYDKTVEAKKLSVVNPVTNPEKFTSAERGSLAFHMPDYLDRFKAVVENVKAGKATLPTVKQVKRAELIRFRDGQDYMTARDILSASTEEDERRYGLIKQARSVQSTIGMADDTEFPRIAKTLYEITNELDGRTDAPAWSDDYLKNPSLMQTMDDMLSNYEGQYAPLAYAEGVVEKGEKLKKDADWFDNLDTPYQAMDVQERKLYQQNIAFEYAQGKKPIMFDLPDEYLKAEQENIDLNGLTEISPGQSLPQFMVIADKNEQEVREQASILEDILATDHGALGDKARKNIEFDLDSLNDQLTAIDGFRYRYENANIKSDAAEGEKAWRVDMNPYAVSTSEDYESMFAFEDRWAKKLAENPNNKALIAQKEQEQLKLGATINRDKAGREILGYEDQYSDYYLVPVMTDQERATYMSYYKTDKAKAHEYAMALDQTLNKRASFELSELTKKLASGTIWEQGLSAVGSVLATVMKGISAIGIITKGITNQKIDPYAAYMEPAIVQQDIRGQLKKNTETAFGKDSIPTKSINLIGDILFGASDTIVGGKTLGFAGYMISGGSDSARDALLRGGNQDQALALMAANVAAEAITEAIPFDAIMGGFKKGFTWRGLFTSGFGEFVGEGASSLLGSEADKEIMLEKSYYETDVKEIEREKKISREEAEKIANKNILKDALYEGIVGLGSGDLAYMVSTRGRRAPKDTSAENAEVAKALDDADLGAAITGIITEYDAGENAPEAEQTEGQNPTTALEEQAAIDEASHEPDHTPQRPETPAQQPISEQGAGETRAEDNQIAPQTAREYEDNDEVKAARAAYEAATAKVNEAIANGVLKPDAEWAAQDEAYQALNDAIDRQGQARIADEQARNPILNPAAEQTEVSSEPVQPADTSLVDALSKEYPVQTIPVEGIKVSPQEYQFKANVDETGVKDKIEGNYIPSYAGTVVVHERADGTRYIADGHHRLSLAARSGIKELQAIVLREADGVTTAMARAFAAARNIASSRGTSIDAAKVFKETGITAEGLYALGLSPNEKNVSEGIALSQVDPQLFDRIAQDEIPLKAGVLIGQIFPNDGTMQREFLRKMAGRNLSYDAMTELANVLKNAREVAATQEQVGFDFLDDPALTNAAEIAEVAARVKNMLARTLSTFKGLSGGKKVDQVGAVGGNEIDTEANRAEANIALDAEIIMRTYWAADSPAFKLIDELAAQYAEGKLTLPKAAEQAYNAVSKIARDAINASKVDAAHGPAADSVAILIGAYGADQSRAFIGNALQAMNNTEYAIQQQTMRNVRDTMTLPIESTARQILDHMITGGKVDAGVLGSFNVAAQQDLSNPIYNDARSNSADESAIANQTAKDIQAGAMQGFDERQALVNGLNDKANALQEKADEANAKYDQAKKAISALNDQSMQPDFVIDESFKKNRTDLQRKQTAAKKSLDKAVEQAQTARKTADDAKAKFDADYAAQLTAIREKAIVSSQKAPNEQGAPLTSVGDIIPVSEKERPKSPKKGQKQGTPVQAMYINTTGGLPISAPTVDYSGPVQSAQTIFTKLGKAIGVPFNVNRRQYMRGLRNTTAGYFIPKSEVVHVKNAQDLTAASHEFGHWVDKRTRIGSHPAILRIVSQLMNDPVFSQNYTPQELNGEAVAEAMKVYMVNREQALAHLGKDFVAELEKGLSELGVLKEFDAARAALGRTIGASTFEQIKARIVSADESGKRTVKEHIRNIRAKTFDSTLVFDEMSKMLRGLRGNNYMMSEDPRMIALKNNRIDNFVKAIIEDRLVNVRGDTILGRGFADNFEGISANEIKAFEAYLIAYHDLDRTKVGKSALGGEFTRQQILSTIAEVEAAHPGWKNNKAMLHEWYDAFFKEYIVKQGVIAQGEYDNMKAMYPNYVPTYRQMGDDAKGAPNKSSGDVKKGLLGAKESDLNIINPIESMARLIMTYTQQAHRLQLGNVFADAIDRYDATGVFAENIQKDMKYRPEIAAIKSEIEQMIAQQEEARQTTLFDSPLGENPDLEKFDQNVLSLLDRSMFTMENTATGANVINILGRDGRYRSYLVHDANMLSVLQSVPSVQLTKVLQWTKNIVGMISATATGTNPFFALTNGVRDMATQMIYGTTSTNVLTAVPKWILNLPRTIAGILSNTTINGHQVLKDNRYTDAYRLYSMFSETGARYSAQIGKTSQTMVEALTSPNAAKKAGKAALKVFTMQFLNEMVENNSRFLEFYSGKSSLGKNRDNLNTFEGRLRAGLAASGVTVDFRRSGASPIMREIGAIVPFFNAGIQGINKAASLFTNENTGRRGQIAAKIVLNMTMLGVLQAVMNNMHLTDDEKEEYETFDEGYKAKSLFLKVGPEKLLRIPMTQDPISLIFYALGRAVGGAATGEGTSVADALVNGAKAVLTESTNFSTIYSPIQNLIENKTWYGSAIESSMMKGYARTERYNERTTGIAKWLSEKTGFLSPVQWDYIIPQYTGVWGKLGLNFVRNATGDATVGEALLETLNKEVSSRMFTTPAYTSQLYNNYKASLDGITQVKNHYRDNRPFSMFDPNLTQDELNLAVTEAHRMTKKGGELYDISEQISAKWDAYNQVLSNASLTDEQRDQGTIAVRQEINQLSLKGQNIIAGYESKYFPGAVRTNERVIGFNVREMTAQGVKEASSMTQTVYDDLQSGKPYAKDYADYSKGIYEKWGSEYILTTKPSKTWKGFNESTASPEKLAAIDRVYFTVVANGLKAQNQAILNAKSAEEADKLIKAITRKAADAAKEEALR